MREISLPDLRYFENIACVIHMPTYIVLGLDSCPK